MSERDEYWQDKLTEQEIACERRIEALEARLAMAREALEPFAAVGTIRMGHIPPSELYLWRRTDSSDPDSPGISAYHIDRAIEVIAALDKP